MADAGYSVRRVRRHFADVQDLILTGRFGASSSESRPSEVGHFRSSDRPKNRRANDRYQSTAAIGRRQLKHDHSPKQSPAVSRHRLISGAGCTPAVRSAVLALPTRCRRSAHGDRRPQCSEDRTLAPDPNTRGASPRFKTGSPDVYPGASFPDSAAMPGTASDLVAVGLQQFVQEQGMQLFDLPVQLTIAGAGETLAEERRPADSFGKTPQTT